ncbi:DUF1329 domain-containing protein [Zavarzinia compransoris]|uniref:DUF1329 domain-containing protein n=1 Tax=Zavarzinia marina TaxID=2911065 RepID=UPI001F25F2F7|nr:DUF1329 domain-containing protein [Zavarzinia marina]MCF4167530.1 DUF1329 domain-containing protein [Zavarzinia marina]
MDRRSFVKGVGGAALLAAMPRVAFAKPTPQEIASLGTSLTPMGSVKEGSADGMITPWTGKWNDVPTGLSWGGFGKPQPDPYAAEQPLFTITAQNMQQYADRLTDGQKAMFARNGGTFRMNVYPCHRDFRPSDFVLSNLKLNAAEAAVTPDGEGVTGVFAAPAFPFAKTGLEMIWNAITVPRGFTQRGIMDEAVVYPDGNIAWGAQKWDIYAASYDPSIARGEFDGASAFVFRSTLKPARNQGEITLVREWWDYGNRPSQAWQYIPGTRRVKQVPEIAGDYPLGPGGFHTVDDTNLWTQSPKRYDWELVGRKEIFIPYNNFGIDDPAIKYKDMLATSHLNPDVVRWELHRVWVLKAKLKAGLRHVYAARTIYIDEDSLNPMLADMYDARGELYRMAMMTTSYDYGSRMTQARVVVYHDLISGAYMADRLSNEVNDRMAYNEGGRKGDDYTPQELKRRGV